MVGRCFLCYITDRTQFRGDERARRDAMFCKIVEAAQAGVDYIQLREKGLISCELESLARIASGLISQLRTENPQLRTKLLINSRTDIALAVGADGVHLRSDDIAVADVRRIVDRFTIRGPLSTTSFLTSVACHSPADVVRAASDGADLAVFAPVFEKKDQPQTQPSGVEILHRACASPIPVLALGGITLENAAACLAAGAAGIAAIRLFQENRIEDIVRILRET
jgi:thiamine-phosphate pyrophosphorylase